MNKLSTQLAVVGTATAMALVFVGAPMVVRADPATNVFCGQNITQDTTMDGDLTCSANSLVIFADNVTLDLGGFTITGCCGSFSGVFMHHGREGVTIKNGTIQGFQVGVFAADPLKLKLSDLILKDNTAEGVNIFEGGEDVVIRNSSFLLPPSSSCGGGNGAIRFEGVTNLDVNNVDVHGGITGVSLECGLCDGSLPPNTGKITNSTFTGTHVGVVIWNTSDMTISKNHFSNIVQTEACEFGFAIISPGQAGPHPRTGITVRDNFIHDNFEGITLNNVVAGAEITGNIIRDNSHFGIGLRERNGLPSTGNLIKDNITSGNGVDLLHDISSSPNTWKDNSYETKDGADIPDC